MLYITHKHINFNSLVYLISLLIVESFIPLRNIYTVSSCIPEAIIDAKDKMIEKVVKEKNYSNSC